MSEPLTHCKDCCCARSWRALGITEYTGMSISEHIERLRAAAETDEKQWKELADDASRLRAALQQIVDIETEYEGCAELARGALGEPKP